MNTHTYVHTYIYIYIEYYKSEYHEPVKGLQSVSSIQMIATGFAACKNAKSRRQSYVCVCVCVCSIVVVGVAHKFQLNAQKARTGHTPMRQTEAGQGPERACRYVFGKAIVRVSYTTQTNTQPYSLHPPPCSLLLQHTLPDTTK